MLFDTHVHLNVEQFDEDVEEVIERAKTAGVEWMNVIGFDRPTIKRAIELAENYEFIYATVGWHPVDAIDMTEEDLSWIEELASHPKVVALGEMGLDYHWDKSPADIQKEVFRKQIRLAQKVNLPIVIHDREAHEDVVAVLQEEEVEKTGGIMHCFGGDAEMAAKCLEMNFYISFGGPVTFKNAKLPKEVAAGIPMDRILIETDCPFLAPHPYRGKRNEPSYVTLIADKIAEIKGMDPEAFYAQTTDNARRLFRLEGN